MHIPKHYFHDRVVLGLQAVNTVLVLFVVLFILLRIDPAASSSPIVQFRSNLGIGAFKSGSVNEFRVFALFAAVQYVFSFLLSIRLYSHRRHLATMILGLTTFLLILCAVVSNALLLQR
jgi:hypothetical protein